MLPVTALIGTALSLGSQPEWAFMGWREESEESEQMLQPNSPIDVSFRPELPSSCTETKIPFTVKGSKYSCCLVEPTAATITADAEAARQILNKDHIVGAEQLLTRSMGRLKGLVWETPGWWEYELCPGSYLRQYHHEEGIIQSEYILGIGDNLLKETSPKCVSSRKYLQQPTKTIHKKLKTIYANTKPSATGKWRMETNPKVGSGQEPYFTTSYYNGEPCADMGGIMRESEIRLICDQNSPNIIFNVSEIRPCKYAASIYLDIVCHTREYTLVKEYLSDDGDELTPKQRRDRAVARRKSVMESKNVETIKPLLMRHLGTPACILWRDSGWWTYELCVFHWLRQYHENNGIIEMEYFVGRGELANTKTDPIMSRPAQYTSGKRTMLQQSVINQKLEANGTWTAGEEAGQYFFKTRMANGRNCDLTGNPREVEVRLYCHHVSVQKFTVNEIATCKYEARLYLRSLCELKEYKYLEEGDGEHKVIPKAKLVCALDSDSTPPSENKPTKMSPFVLMGSTQNPFRDT
eukprot:TRINITY_DN515_c1_g1_i1.p1 TRINITY_DN515_c1_g1~~TRINITY_DN515_c1_g1_i1.p1  ORF type:complete len:523 (+),score=91.99 TRINITY_DN515_c1_g1_i1:39-1607(+)